MVEQLGEKASPKKGWDRILLDKSNSVEEGFEMFFEYLEKFNDIWGQSKNSHDYFQ